MSKLIDMRGQKYGRLVGVALVSTCPTIWRFKCECGKSKNILAINVRKGLTSSCGCLHSEVCSALQWKHGKTGSRAYNTWNHMLRRCKPDFPDYGARGIKVSKRWLKFENFYADMGDPPVGMSLDRKNNNGNYSKRNCRWATHKQQARNTRANRYVLFNDRLLTLAEHCESQKLNYAVVQARMGRLGWTIDDALSTPVRHFSRRKGA